jgi:phosphoribosylaminoimidazole (AIR) synthetase
VQQASGADRDEIFHTLNMGIGMVLVAPEDLVDEIVDAARQHEYHAWAAGRVVEGSGLTLR